MSRSVPCAGAVVLDERGRLLVIRRGQPPSEGLWSVPGGRCLPDEPSAIACVRETREETGVDVEVVRAVGTVLRDAPDGSVYVIDDFLCRPLGGTLRAGDDAIGARWVTRAELDELPVAPGVVDALRGWDVLPM